MCVGSELSLHFPSQADPPQEPKIETGITHVITRKLSECCTDGLFVSLVDRRALTDWECVCVGGRVGLSALSPVVE